MTNAFSNLSLAEPIARAVAGMGYESMTPIQAQAIPVVLAGQDVMGAAQTGTGKTAAFSLPLLQRLMKHENASASPARHPVRALVLLPTRELADQVAQQIKQYAQHTQLRSAVVFGGVDMKPQVAALKAGVEVLVATPGRLLDHIESKSVVLNQVEYVVLDEADRMLDIGFLPDLQRILSHLPPKRTTLLFSATFSPEIKKLAGSYLTDPVTIEVARPNETASTVEQRFYSVHEDDKRRAIDFILRERGIKQAFVFTNSKIGCGRLARSLERDGWKTAALHGNKTQDERLKSLEAFKAGEVELLVCTDVAARGLDIKDVPAVFNHDIPFNAEDYVHRIGRTGRAGASGLAVSLSAGGNDNRLVSDIEKLIKKKIELETLDLRRRDRTERTDRGERGDRGERRDRADRTDMVERNSEYRERSDRGNGDVHARRERGGSHVSRGHKSAPADPFFDRPYEPTATGDVSPAWDAQVRSGAANAAAEASTSRKGASAAPSGRVKRRVAALFAPPRPRTELSLQREAQRREALQAALTEDDAPEFEEVHLGDTED